MLKRCEVCFGPPTGCRRHRSPQVPPAHTCVQLCVNMVFVTDLPSPCDADAVSAGAYFIPMEDDSHNRETSKNIGRTNRGKPNPKPRAHTSTASRTQRGCGPVHRG